MIASVTGRQLSSLFLVSRSRMSPISRRNFAASSPTRVTDGLSALSAKFTARKPTTPSNSSDLSFSNFLTGTEGTDSKEFQNYGGILRTEEDHMHRFHVFSHKHNTHITLARPDASAIISVAAGNINIRKAARGTYDAAYQLVSWVLGRIQQEGHLKDIYKLEVVFRGFGKGRDAVTKALLGNEGRNLRSRVVKVTDATRLKFGGTRSPKPRRLG